MWRSWWWNLRSSAYNTGAQQSQSFGFDSFPNPRWREEMVLIKQWAFAPGSANHNDTSASVDLMDRPVLFLKVEEKPGKGLLIVSKVRRKPSWIEQTFWKKSCLWLYKCEEPQAGTINIMQSLVLQARTNCTWQMGKVYGGESVQTWAGPSCNFFPIYPEQNSVCTSLILLALFSSPWF